MGSDKDGGSSGEGQKRGSSKHLFDEEAAEVRAPRCRLCSTHGGHLCDGCSPLGGMVDPRVSFVRGR